MGFLSVIRRWALREGMPICEISRRMGLSRNTIKKYLREGAVEPKFKTPKQTRSVRGSFVCDSWSSVS
jgi:transcriptional regulator with XRE-family HTH domain